MTIPLQSSGLTIKLIHCSSIAESRESWSSAAALESKFAYNLFAKSSIFLTTQTHISTHTYIYISAHTHLYIQIQLVVFGKCDCVCKLIYFKAYRNFIGNTTYNSWQGCFGATINTFVREFLYFPV